MPKFTIRETVVQEYEVEAETAGAGELPLDASRTVAPGVA